MSDLRAILLPCRGPPRGTLVVSKRRHGQPLPAPGTGVDRQPASMPAAQPGLVHHHHEVAGGGERQPVPGSRGLQLGHHILGDEPGHLVVVGELPTAEWGRLRAVPYARVARSGPWRGNVARTLARYDEFAEWYEQWIGGVPPLIAAHAGLLPAVAGEPALDMACGQGRMSRHLARPGQMLSESTSRPRCSTRPAPQPNGLPGLGGGRLRPACWHDLHRGDGHHAGGLTGHRHALRAWSPRPGWTGRCPARMPPDWRSAAARRNWGDALRNGHIPVSRLQRARASGQVVVLGSEVWYRSKYRRMEGGQGKWRAFPGGSSWVEPPLWRPQPRCRW